jgi:DNA-binding MurR/RpiR family transcriptional regulator
VVEQLNGNPIHALAMKPDDYLFRKLNGRIQDLSRNQRTLAKYVLTHYQKVAFSTIRQLAGLTGVSEATIVRFVKTLDFRGYPAFQKEIRRIVRVDLKGTERFKLTHEFRSQEPGPLSGIIQKEFENISYLQEVFDGKEFKKALGAVRKADEVVVVGTRSTASLANHFWFGLAKLDIKARRILSVTAETYDYLNKLDQEALVVVIGFPRYLRELVDLLSFSKGKGVKTIAITDSPFSPLRGDISLYTPAESISFVAFHCAPMILINGMLNELSLMDKEKTLKALSHFEALAEARKYFYKG